MQLESCVQIKCPDCSSDIVVGLGLAHPTELYALTPKDMEANRRDLLNVIDESTLPDPQKAALKSQYAGKDVMVSPDACAAMKKMILDNYSQSEITKKGKRK